MKKSVYSVLGLWIILMIGSCATGSTIVTGEKRTPISPDEVQLFLDPPAQYETIGVVEVVSPVGLSRQSAQDKAMKELKKRAAKLGANGVLLSNTGHESTTSAGYFTDGIYFGGTSSDKLTAQGRAIFVERK